MPRWKAGACVGWVTVLNLDKFTLENFLEEPSYLVFRNKHTSILCKLPMILCLSVLFCHLL